MQNMVDALQAGITFHSAGNLPEAERIYRQILQANPRHAMAMYLLGTIALQVAKHSAAIQYLAEAIRIDGAQAAFHATLGETYQALGQWDEAIVSYRQAVRLDPQYAEAHNNLGTVLQTQGNVEGAAASYRAAIRVQPQGAAAHHNLGVVLHVQGDVEQALELFAKAARLDPAYFDAQFKLGHTLYDLARPAEAIAPLEAAVALNPGSQAAQCALGVVYQSQARDVEAIACYRRAIRIQPDFAEAHFNLGTALGQQDQWTEAIHSYQEALRLNPAYFAAHINLSATYAQVVRPDLAIAAARRALELEPESPLALAHLAIAVQSQGEMEEAISTFRQVIELEPADSPNHSNLVYSLNFDPRYDAATIFAEHLTWGKRHAEPLTAAAAPHENDRTPERRLRVGYVSSHFRTHAVSFFSEPMLAAHDPRQVEVFCYADVRLADAVTERFRARADAWRNIAGLSHDAVARLVRQDKIDILVDLAGHIGGNHLLVFARKPAPVQVTYLGYQNTTGMSAMDYRITDEHADPPGQTDAYYTERLVRLPRSFFCFMPLEPAPAVNELPALTKGHVTFASLNHANKITGKFLATCAEILTAVPRSRLIVLAYSGGQFERNVRSVMERAGIDPARVEVVNKRPRYEYLQLHESIDIALDSFPFNGHTTVCDALWMGVPSVMLEGTSYASRFGGSTLVNLGLEELIARTTGQYVEIAVALAGDLERLAALRRGLRARMQESPLLDAAGFTRNLETAYRQMWRQWCQAAETSTRTL